MILPHSPNQSAASYFRSIPLEERERLFNSLTAREQANLEYDWEFWSRPNQRPPEGDWDIWLLLSGRGFGKTRTGAEYLRLRQAQGYSRMIMVADDAKDARDIMIEGESGLLSIYPKSECPRYIPSQAKVEWPNGATAILYSASDPDSLRGPQGDTAWVDELGKWKRHYQRKAWDNLMFGMRLGRDPRVVVSTTPTPTDVVKALVAQAKAGGRVIVTGGATHENLENLAPTFARQVMQYDGTRIGRQELYAELLDDVPGALWTALMLSRARVDPAILPHFARIVVAVDPAVSATESSNETGIIVVGSFENTLTRTMDAVVLEDVSGKYSPEAWARAVDKAYVRWHADRVVAEVNQGGDLVEANLRQVDRSIPVKQIHAKRGKYLRAEPVATLYEQDRVKHAGLFPELEAQMSEWVPGEDSPDRLDALVHGITDLVIEGAPVRTVILASPNSKVARPGIGPLAPRVPIEEFPRIHRSRL
jgi:phage terminase large subunit-like protein